MDLEGIMLCEMSQRKSVLYDFTQMQNQKTNEQTKGRNRPINAENKWLPEEGGWKDRQNR